MFFCHIVDSFHIFKVIEDSTDPEPRAFIHFQPAVILVYCFLVHLLQFLDEEGVFELGGDIQKAGFAGELIAVEVEGAEEFHQVVDEGGQQEVVEEGLLLLLQGSEHQVVEGDSDQQSHCAKPVEAQMVGRRLQYAQETDVEELVHNGLALRLHSQVLYRTIKLTQRQPHKDRPYNFLSNNRRQVTIICAYLLHLNSYKLSQMNKLQLPQAKLLYAVSELYRQRRIDETEKRILKQKIITDNPEIYEILEQHDNEAQLYEVLVNLVRKPEEPVQDTQNAQTLASVEQEEASSPWGEFLRRKKGSNQHKHKFETNAIKELLNPQKTE